MSSLADFNFSGDDPGPSTDPTVDPVDADPMSEGEPGSEEAYDDTNYKEPGLGEEFAGNEPTSFDSEGNSEDPNTQKSDVPPVEAEAESVTATKESNPVERDLDPDVEEALELLINLGLKDYVFGVVNEEFPEIKKLEETQRPNWWQRLNTASQKSDRVMAGFQFEDVVGNTLGAIDKNLMKDLKETLFFHTEIGALLYLIDINPTINNLIDANRKLRASIPGQNNYWRSIDRILANLHKEFNKADDEDLLEPEDDQGDIDEAQGSVSPNDTDLEIIELDDWLGISPDQQDNVDYLDLNDYLAPDMHTVDEYVDLNDYMGDMIQESFLEEFMFVAQDEI